MQDSSIKKNGRDVGGYAGVYLLDIPYSADRMYDYYIPPELRASAVPGAFAVVPFGGGNRKRVCVIAEIHNSSEAQRTKPILSVSSDTLPLTVEQLSICRYVASMTLCTVGDAIRAAVPSGSAKTVRIYRTTDTQLPSDGGALSHGAIILYEYIKAKVEPREEVIAAKFGSSADGYLRELVANGYIEADAEVTDTGLKYEKYYSLDLNEEEAKRLLVGDRVREMKRKMTLPSQIGVIYRLMSGPASERELLDGVDGLTQSQLATMLQNRLLTVDRREAFRDPVLETGGGEKPLEPNEEQTEALNILTGLALDGKPHGALLYGVTGSGKTTVILGMIDRMIEYGRGSIVLLPEISLTPQMLTVFCSRYGSRVAVMHSGLSTGERYDAYIRVKRGLADIVVGTRSAVFAPVKNLGMIVIDEEQEHTYKSDMTPKYHARDIARKRCADSNALMLLSSATPSIESFKKAKDGVYTLVRLTKRYGEAKLPEVTVSDMRIDAQNGISSPIGNELASALLETYKKGEQSILFLNRRGYNSSVSCVHCGEVIKCPSCSVAMTYHTKRGTYDDGELVCHWCGRKMPMPRACPSCSKEPLNRCGYGTQRVEQELSGLLPDARLLRMDADTTTKKLAYDKLLTEFRERGDLLLGTQMVTKGHDFPRVTLVGVLLADMSLYLDDYRANERTFALLTQVIGRAGRSSRAGRAIIQTNNPDNDIIRLASAQDYDTFFENEIKLRRLLTFPPFCDIVLLTVSHTDERELVTVTELLRREYVKALDGEYKDVPQVTFGPFEAPVYKVDDRYRMRFVIKCRLNKRSRELFAELLSSFSSKYGGNRGIQLSIDFNPSNL